MRYLILMMLSVAVLTGCSQSIGSKSSSTYPSAVAWNNSLYALSVVEVPVDEVGAEIGKIDRRTSPMPKRNGESNDKPVGSLLYEMKGKDSQAEIAVKVNEKYYSASKLGPLE